MGLIGGVPLQPKFYRSAVQEGDLVRLPPEVCQVLRVRPGHRVDFRVLEDRWSSSTPGPAASCAAARRSSGRSGAPFSADPVWRRSARPTCLSRPSPTTPDCGRDRGRKIL